jgi:hypothetical protein
MYNTACLNGTIQAKSTFKNIFQNTRKQALYSNEPAAYSGRAQFRVCGRLAFHEANKGNLDPPAVTYFSR